MRTPLRTATMLLGAFFLLQGVAWIADPQRAAAGLGMPLLEGLGRSTQIGDLASFFLTAGATMLAGARPGRARLLYVPAGMLGAAATVRTLAWAFQGAAFAAAFISIEIAAAVLLCAAARRLDGVG